VDDLKIDKSFVRNLGKDQVDAAICRAVLTLAHEVGLSVTAEGVETAQQLDWLREHGCDIAQGYLIARPMSAHQIVERYADRFGAMRQQLRSG
jgi:EAL domain-containing protein (putative c-di-GMP-specific phosphodiesterase class I)